MPITWNNTIKQQFDQFSIDHMKQVTGNSLKLDDYESVKTWAGQIWDQVSNDYMPPGDPWTDDQKSNFSTWMNNGMPEGDAPMSSARIDTSADGPTSGRSASVPASITWTNTIKAQFTQFDIDHMKQVSGGSLDLSSYASVKANGSGVYSMVSRKRMPPGNPWSDQFIQNFNAWMTAGYPES
jgi:hypothetical protein